MPATGRSWKRTAIQLSLVFGIVTLALLLLFEAIAKIRESAQRLRTANVLKQVNLGIHSFHDNFKRLPEPQMNPFGFHFPEKDSPGLSWRLAMEPYLESMMEHSIFRKFAWDEPWDSPKNMTMFDRMYVFYEDSSRPQLPAGHTYFQLMTGPKTIFNGEKRTLASIKDGLANTILVAIATEEVPWTKPQDIVYDPQGPLPRLGDPCKSRILVGFADGRVLWLERPGETLLRALITAEGGEPIELSRE
jgi:hypothetical protein